jgi:adenylate cyclase
VLVSDHVHSQVRGKIDVSFSDSGEIALKNIETPVRAWSWTPAARPAEAPLPDAARAPAREQLSIAVLPFNNMSADPEQEFLADGISEDIITGLSKIRWFLVIARNSTFTYKGQAVDVTRVAKELGVRYVLEGSVRKGGNRIRVTAQLIDADTGLHVWAERYDRELEDIFDLQDEITQTIVARIEPEISAAERQKIAQRRTDSLGAWECYQRGLWYMWDYSPENHRSSVELLSKATELDPNFSTAYAYLCYAHYEGVVMGWSDDPDLSLQMGLDAARTAIRIDNRDPVGYFAAGRIHMMQGRHDDSIAALEKSIELNPSFSQAYHGLSMVLTMAGRLDDAREAGKRTERLSPRDPILWATTIVHAWADVLAGDWQSALAWVQKTKQLARGGGYWIPAVEAAALVQAGRIEEARARVQDARRALPKLSVSYLADALPTKYPGGLDPYLDALRAAGLPE